MGRKRIKTIKYADDQALLVESVKELEFMVENIVRVWKEFDVKINVGKTEFLRTGKNQDFINIFLEGKTVE